MANRFPLVLDTTDGNKIKEIPAGDNLDLRNVSIEDVQNINALGTINAAAVQINGENLKAGVFTDLTDVPNAYTGFEGYLVKVKDDASGLEFVPLGAGDNDFAVQDIILVGDITPATTNTSDIGSETRRLANIHANIFHGSLKGFDGSTVFDATTNQIPYAVVAGAPQVVSDLENDAEYITRAQLKATLPEVLGEDLTIEVNQTGNLIGSVFGEDSTILVDHINSRINAARLTQNGATDGQTIVWNATTEVWEPGIAGDITGLSSDKVDTLTVETGYKLTFADNPGLVEGAGIKLTATTSTIDLDGNTRLTGTNAIYPETTSNGYVGTSTNVFLEGNFDTINATTFSGELQGTAVTTTAKSDIGVFGDKTGGNGGYQLHVIGDLGVTLGSIWLNGNSINGANLVAATGDFRGSVFGDDSTPLVDAVNNKLSGDLEFQTTTGYIRGDVIAIEPVTRIDLGETQTLGSIVPITNGQGTIGTIDKKYEEGNFQAVNADSLSVASFSTDNFTTTNFTISGTGVGEITSSTDVVITVGNRARFTGGPIKFPLLTQAERTALVAQSGDSFYNSTSGTFEFYQNGIWVGLNKGLFEGDVIGSIYSDASTQIFDGVSGKLTSPTVSGDALFENNVTVSGNLIVQGTTTSIETTNTNIKDNVIVLNSGEVGTGVTAGSAGISVDRGGAADVTFVWDEATDRWTVGNTTFFANSLQGDLTGDVTGTLTGNVTGNVTGNLTGNVTGNLTGNSTGYHTGDMTGSVFADDSSVIVDAVNNRLFAESFDGIAVRASIIDSPTGSGLLQIKAGDVSDSGNVIFINPYGSNTFINSKAETHVWATGAYSDLGTNPYIDFKTAGAFTAHDGAYFVGNLTGNVTGNVTGDLKGTVVADDSTILVDSVAGKIRGDIESDSVNVTATSGSVQLVSGGSTVQMRGTNAFGSITYDDSDGSILLGTTGTINITGAATSPINIGGGTTGKVTIGHGGNNVQINVSSLELDIANVPANSTGSDGDKAGMVAFDSTSIYYCIADWASPGTADIWVKTDWATTGAW